MTVIAVRSIEFQRRVMLCLFPLDIRIGGLSVTVVVIVQVVSAVSRTAVMLLEEVSIQRSVIGVQNSCRCSGSGSWGGTKGKLFLIPKWDRKKGRERRSRSGDHPYRHQYPSPLVRTEVNCGRERIGEARR